jgi:hypothetical protein
LRQAVRMSRGDARRLGLRVATPLGLLACLASLAFLAACGGTTPLLHPAHGLAPGKVTVGLGSTGRVAMTAAAGESGSPERDLEHAAVAAGVAPWVGARVGLAGDNEAGLAWAGRSLRLDARHVFPRGSLALSLGVGGSLVLPERRYGDERIRSFRGGGVDVPVLFGWSSQSGIYTVWLGPRAGVELLEGSIPADAATAASPSEVPPTEVSARHVSVGGVLGLRVGFRHVYVALEADGAFHAVDGTVGDTNVSLQQGSVSPGGALVIGF